MANPNALVILMRHGHRLDFVQPQWFETATYPYDPPLSANGWYQAFDAVSKLRHFPIQKIFTSPYLRALQTAHPIAQALGLLPCIENGLREWLNSDWSSCLPVTMPPTETPHPIPFEPDYFSLWPPQYPETEQELYTRANFIADKLIIESPSCNLIVAHKHILLAMVQVLTSQDFPEAMMLPGTVILLTSEVRLRDSWMLHQL